MEHSSNTSSFNVLRAAQLQEPHWVLQVVPRNSQGCRKEALPGAQPVVSPQTATIHAGHDHYFDLRWLYLHPAVKLTEIRARVSLPRQPAHVDFCHVPGTRCPVHHESSQHLPVHLLTRSQGRSLQDKQCHASTSNIHHPEPRLGHVTGFCTIQGLSMQLTSKTEMTPFAINSPISN